MKYFKTIRFISVFIVLISCHEKEEDYLIEEPVGSADYHVTNRSDYDLAISFTTSVALGTTTDNSKSVARNASVSILKDGIFGMNPKPTNSFSKIQLFITNDSDITLVFTLDPMVNDRWEITEQETYDTGLSFTKYELVITNDDITIQ